MIYSGFDWHRGPKYGNKRTEVDGIVFDSRKEANRWAELQMMEKAGVIQRLERQKTYVLIPGMRWSDGKKHRDTIYKADFVYIEDGKTVVEDVKGVRTPVYKLKRELMKQIYDIEIREV